MYQDQSLCWSESTVLKSMIETISLTTPSPKIQLKSLGYFSYSTILTTATVSELHKSEVISKICITEMPIGAGFSE